MIEITDAAANEIKSHLINNKVVRMFLAAIDATGANYGLAMTDPEEDDVIFDSNGISLHMSPADADLLGETIIDFVDDEERGRGFIIRGPLDDLGGCGCSHDHGEEDEGDFHSCGCH